VVDFGTRGLDLAYALLDGYDVVIFVDATRRGGRPGTLYTLEPYPDDPGGATASGQPIDTHGVDLPAVFRLVRVLGGRLPCLRLVGCEPATLGSDEEGAMGLSEPVLAAVDGAVGLVAALVAESLGGA
jgi:hydrogenase maturation protease